MTHPQVVRAKARLDQLDWYPRPVGIRRVRLFTAPWFFRLPWLRRFDGYALHGTILVRDADPPDDLVVHELCHVWQSIFGRWYSSDRPSLPRSRLWIQRRY